MTDRDPLTALRRVLEVARFDKTIGDGALAEMLNEAIDPIIRADEREQMAEWVDLYPRERAALLADLRAKVEGLLTWNMGSEPAVNRAEVLAAFDEEAGNE
jgi:hypothetical protein